MPGSILAIQTKKVTTMHWLADYWWVILVLFVGVILNAIKDLKRVDHKKISAEPQGTAASP